MADYLFKSKALRAGIDFFSAILTIVSDLSPYLILLQYIYTQNLQLALAVTVSLTETALRFVSHF